MRLLKTAILLLSLLGLVGMLGYQVEIVLLQSVPAFRHTLTTSTQLAPAQVGTREWCERSRICNRAKRLANADCISSQFEGLTRSHFSQPAIAMNRADNSLQKINVEVMRQEYWVDQKAGYSGEAQTNLIQFLLSLDDDLMELPLEIAQAMNQP